MTIFKIKIISKMVFFHYTTMVRTDMEIKRTYSRFITVVGLKIISLKNVY